MDMKLLVADDEPSIRNGIAKYIRLHSNRFSEVLTAEDGQEAIDLIVKYQPEILLLDIQMPLRDGIEVMAEAKKAGLLPETVILSGYDDFRYAQQALRYGARDYLLKPCRSSDVVKLVNSIADEIAGEETPVIPEEMPVTGNRFVEEAKKQIGLLYDQNITLELVAEKAGISAGYLSTLFTQNLGMNFIEYLNNVRIDRACVFLKQSGLKTYEVAYRVGFRDEKYFSKVFRKIKGMTPSEYRRNVKE